MSPSSASGILLTRERPSSLAADYNRASFQFQHDRHVLEIFDLPQLIEMAARLPDAAYYSTAEAGIRDGWKNLGESRPTLRATLESLAESNSLVLLKHCEKDPEHGGIFRAIIDETIERCGTLLRDDVEIARATLVISSPRRITSYHIDAEINFLLQMRGKKTLNVFDPRDPAVLSDQELEAFYSGDWDGAQYKAERQGRANVFELEPGEGIHIPLHAPHWAQNGDDVAVGLSLNFNLRSGAKLAKLYKVNHRLRKAGIRPAPPGVSAWQDRLKLAAFALLRPAKA
ncbi:MAG TPA: cupin-like domain-containing protein [Candidatus Baltobacteraceae bacterium]|nr:cupin-like domain-containing protein [Candidatus Baltobacteraceae bacterium]